MLRNVTAPTMASSAERGLETTCCVRVELLHCVYIFQIDKNIRKSPHNVSLIGLQSLPDVLQHPVVQCVQLYHIMYHTFLRRNYSVM